MEVPPKTQIKSILSLESRANGNVKKVYSPGIIEKAAYYSSMAERVVKKEKGMRGFPVPEFLPGPNGSIYVLWKGRFCERGFIEPYRMLLKVPIEEKTAELSYLTIDGERSFKTNIYLDRSLFQRQ